MTGADFIQLAGRLAARPNEHAAAYRTAVSRAYYGAFHLAQSLLVRWGFTPSRLDNAHVFVQHLLIGSGHVDAASAGRLLENLHGNRLKADYDLDFPPADQQRFAQMAVERTHRLMRLLESCQNEATSTQIAAGIRAYLQARGGKER
jgi:uncharacterized protein (UPF0332 family)